MTTTDALPDDIDEVPAIKKAAPTKPAPGSGDFIACIMPGCPWTYETPAKPPTARAPISASLGVELPALVTAEERKRAMIIDREVTRHVSKDHDVRQWVAALAAAHDELDARTAADFTIDNAAGGRP